MLDAAEWLRSKFEGLTSELERVWPSEWAEEKRYLPKSVTDHPGPFSYDVCPYWVEVVDCLDPRSPIQEINVMKAAQICFTTGVLENGLGWIIDRVKSLAVIMMTAESEMAQIRIDQNITPMIQQSGLSHLIAANDEINKKKSGKTNKKIQWVGGGYLLPQGARNAAKMRSTSAPFILEDEVDGYLQQVGADGDPCKLVEDRSRGSYQTRKIFRGSTPLIKETSKINREYLRGDQRRLFVPCLKCGEKQILEFDRTDKETGRRYGLIYDHDNGVYVEGSARYVCRYCGHEHRNSDKLQMLRRDVVEWRPTAKPKNKRIRSYQLSALYSPAEMYPWEAICIDWLEAWDPVASRPRDIGLLQTFYNNNLGIPFEAFGNRLKLSAVSKHRRNEYRFGEVPNQFAAEVAGGAIQMLITTVDVHDDNLAVGVFGFSPGARAWLIDYWRFEGDTNDIECLDTWGRLADHIENKVYIADDGREYCIGLTLVDSGYKPDTVYRFCAQYDNNVFPIKGRDIPPRGAQLKEFSTFTTTLGTPAYNITVDLYKDRWSYQLSKGWYDTTKAQPNGHFNAPIDINDKQLKELTVEYKRPKVDPKTNKHLGFEWYRPSGVKNELWDLLIYATCALEILAWDLCVNQLEMDYVVWGDFWALAEDEQRWYTVNHG